MESELSYWKIWMVYLLATGVFYWFLHRLTKTRSPSWGCYVLRAGYLALVLTPAYANNQGNSLAPALMVSTLDLITMGAASISRALIPLILMLSASLVMATIAYFYKKKQFLRRS